MPQQFSDDAAIFDFPDVEITQIFLTNFILGGQTAIFEIFVSMENPQIFRSTFIFGGQNYATKNK